MDVSIYIQGNKLDLFDDERIEINSTVKNISDISKIFADFSQTFTVPASPNNNNIFSYWYESDIDGTFNANLRADAYIEINTLPYKYGSIQLDNAKLKRGIPYSYSITFYGNTVNLSDLFKDDEIKDLDLSEYDHVYSPAVVNQGFNSLSINNGDIYYPLINASGEMSIGTTGDRDLINPSNQINYKEFKPALRLLRIIEAIESKYSVSFSRDFFDRSVFYNAFLWLHKDAGNMVALGEEETVQLSSHTQYGFVFDSVSDAISYSGIGAGFLRRIGVKVIPASGYETTPYKVTILNNGNVEVEKDGIGTKTFPFTNPNSGNVVQVRVQAGEQFNFTTQITALRISVPPATSDSYTQTTPLQSIDAYVFVKNQMPEIKVKDFFNSLIAEFNLIIRPITKTSFLVDTLDNWYSKGKAYDITRLVNIEDIGIKRPDVKKQISFLYQKAGTILAEQYFQNNNIGYGDLKATYDIDGNELKIETQFENMLFERLPKESDGSLTNIQAGYSIDKNLKPYKGKPIMFYRNAYAKISDTIYIQPSGTFNKLWHTATEDNYEIGQVTSSLNFGDDISTFFYSAIERSLYFNWWKTYIEDLYNRKTRVLTLKTILPVSVLYRLQLNDRLIIGDKKYKISSYKSNLVDGYSEIEIFSDFSPPVDSVENIIPITVDSTEYTVDTELLTVDMTALHEPITSYTINGISIANYYSTSGEENFEVKISANTNWTVTKINDGYGIGWYSTNKTNGNNTDYVRVKVNESMSGFRSGILRFTIGGDTFDLKINQND